MFCSSRWSKLPHEARQLSKMAKSPEGHHSNSAGSMSPDCSASRGLGGVLKERSRKLLIPLAFGMAVLGPFLRWREMEHGLSRDIHGNYLPARRVPYKHVLAAYYRDPELVTWSHLWFLAYLWTFSILYAPVWAFVSPGVNRRIADKPSRAKIVLFLSLCAVTASEVMLRPRWPGFQNLVDDWANFASYSAYLVLGLLIGSLPTLKHIVRQHATALLVAGLATSTWFAGFCFQGSNKRECNVARGIGGWTTSAGAVGLALQLGSQKDYPATTLQRFLRRAAFPIYILHQVVVVSLAEFPVFGLRLSVLGKLATLTSLTTTVSAGLYQLTYFLPLLPQLIYGASFK